MSIASRMVKPHKGPLRVADNPKGYLLKAINKQRTNPTWVDKDRNGVRVNVGKKILFPVQDGTKDGKPNYVSMMLMGKDEKPPKDFKNIDHYLAFLDEFENDVNSGALDAYIDAWAEGQ